MVKKILKDLHKAKILSTEDNIEVCDPVDIKYAYIIYERNYRQSVQTILNFLAANNITSIGRYGRWKYMSMEDVILDGKRIAELFR